MDKAILDQWKLRLLERIEAAAKQETVLLGGSQWMHELTPEEVYERGVKNGMEIVMNTARNFR